MNARFLNEEEKYYATQRLAANRTGIADKAQWKWSQAREALLDIKVWFIFFFNIAINIPNGGLLTFGSIIIKGLGFSALESSLLTMPFGVFATFGAWIFSFTAAKWRNRRTIVASIALLLPLTGTALVYGVSRSVVPVQMFGLYLMYLYWRKLMTLYDSAALLIYSSSLRCLYLSSTSQYCWSHKEGCHICYSQHWLLSWKLDRSSDLQSKPSSPVHRRCHCYDELLLHLYSPCS